MRLRPLAGSHSRLRHASPRASSPFLNAPSQPRNSRSATLFHLSHAPNSPPTSSSPPAPVVASTARVVHPVESDDEPVITAAHVEYITVPHDVQHVDVDVDVDVVDADDVIESTPVNPSSSLHHPNGPTEQSFTLHVETPSVPTPALSHAQPAYQGPSTSNNLLDHMGHLVGVASVRSFPARRGYGRTPRASSSRSITSGSSRPIAYTTSSRNAPTFRRHVSVTPSIGDDFNSRVGSSMHRISHVMHRVVHLMGPVLNSGLTEGAEFQYLRGLHDDRALDYEHLIRLDEQLVRDKNRADDDQIGSLPLVKATASDTELRCCVCMCDVEEGEELRVLPCSHKYHKSCIDGKLLLLMNSLCCNEFYLIN